MNLPIVAVSLRAHLTLSAVCTPRREDRISEAEQPKQQHVWEIRLHSQQLSGIGDLHHQLGHYHL